MPDSARHPEPAWVNHVMWWHVYPLGFVGAPIRPDGFPAPEGTPVQHRLGHIQAWLDHVVALGLNGLQLGPVFASSTHGYDTLDFYCIDPRLGDEEDFIALVKAAKDRGIRVILDGVFNHVSREHPLFCDVEQHGPDAASATMFRIDWEQAPDGRDWKPGDPVPTAVFEGHNALVTLNHDSPAVVGLVVDVMRYWLDRGIDGWRLDAAYAMPPEFWAKVLPQVRETHPNAWFTGEVIHGDYAAIVAESTMDSLTQYELWQGTWHSIKDANFFELAHAIKRHSAMIGTFIPSTFVGNHDVTRIASVIGDDFLPHALAVLFTVAGTPAIYAGDEYAYLGVKEQRLGGDDAVRPAFPDTPPPATELAPRELAALRTTQSLVALRRENPWLHTARTDIVHVKNTTMVLRTATGSGAMVCALNLGDTPARLPRAGATRVIRGEAQIDSAFVQLPAFGWAILS